MCFLILLRIVDIILSPVISHDLCGYLKVLIEEHHTVYISLYTDKEFTPKFHYLVHYPDPTGPLVCSWNMRNEAKLSFFKRASHIGNNFKNITLTLASRHQKLLCYELSSGALLTSTFQCGPCSHPTLLSSEPPSFVQLFLDLFPDINDGPYLSCPVWIKSGNMLLKTDNCYVITGITNLSPVFGKVLELIVIHDCTILLLDLYVTPYILMNTNIHIK